MMSSRNQTLWSTLREVQHVLLQSIQVQMRVNYEKINKIWIQINPLFMIMVSQEVRKWLMFLLDNSWDGGYAMNMTNLHSGSLSLPLKLQMTKAIDSRA